MVGSMPILKVPASECSSSAIISLILLARAITLHACSTTSFPMAVGVTCCEERSKIFTPSSFSSFCIMALSVGCVTPHDSAALAKCLSRYTATIYSICCSVIISSTFVCICFFACERKILPRTDAKIQKICRHRSVATEIIFGSSDICSDVNRGFCPMLIQKHLKTPYIFSGSTACLKFRQSLKRASSLLPYLNFKHWHDVPIGKYIQR